MVSIILFETHKNRWVELIIDTAKDSMIWFLIITSLLFSFLKYYNQAIILFLAIIPLIGIEKIIPASQIVPGDLVVVSSGHYFPAVFGSFLYI